MLRFLLLSRPAPSKKIKAQLQRCKKRDGICWERIAACLFETGVEFFVHAVELNESLRFSRLTFLLGLLQVACWRIDHRSRYA
jgi:hypothetical protein